jgi:hypothetical protein
MKAFWDIAPSSPYYPLGTIGTVPRAYDIRPTKAWKKENKNKVMTK